MDSVNSMDGWCKLVGRVFLTCSNGFSASSWNRPLSSQFLRNLVGVGVWSGGGEGGGEVSQ